MGSLKQRRNMIMNMDSVVRLAVVVTGIVAVSLAGCGRGDGGTGGGAPGGGAAVLPAGLFLDQEPEGLTSVLEAKQHAKEGDRVVVAGRIGGTREPFVNGRAVMTIVDKALPNCADNPDDHCPTPWDYCCEERGDIVAHAATVHVAAPGGGPLRADLKGAGGLQPAAEIVVVGRVGQTSSPTAFLIEAEGIYVRR